MLPGAYVFRMGSLRTANSLTSRNISFAPPARTLMLYHYSVAPPPSQGVGSRQILSCIQEGTLESRSLRTAVHRGGWATLYAPRGGAASFVIFKGCALAFPLCHFQTRNLQIFQRFTNPFER